MPFAGISIHISRSPNRLAWLSHARISIRAAGHSYFSVFLTVCFFVSQFPQSIIQYTPINALAMKSKCTNGSSKSFLTLRVRKSSVDARRRKCRSCMMSAAAEPDCQVPKKMVFRHLESSDRWRISSFISKCHPFCPDHAHPSALRKYSAHLRTGPVRMQAL